MMALSRFTPWFAVSALMPPGSSSTHSSHLDLEKYKCYVKAFPFIFIYPSFEVHAYISPTNNACLFAAPSIWYRVRDIGKSNTTCVLSSNAGDISDKGQDLRLYDILCESSLTPFWIFHIYSSKPSFSASSIC